MDISLTAAYFIYCSEDITGGNDIYCSIEFKNTYDKSGLFVSYKQFIQDNTDLQRKFIIKGNKANWESINKRELDCLFEIEKKRLSNYHKIEDVYKIFIPTNNTLPIKLYPINEKKIVFAVNHVYSNGYGVLYWLNEWLGYAFDKKLEKGIGLLAIPTAEKCNFLKRIPYKVSSMVNAIRYLTSFQKNAGKDFYRRSIHCLRHDYSINKKQRYEFKTYNFNEKETSMFFRNAKLNKQTISGYLTSILCKFLYEKYLDQDRICITYPFDMRKELGISNKEIGNYTSNLNIQVFKNVNIDKQIRRQYELKNKGIPYGIANLVRICYKEKNIRADIIDNCRKSFEDRRVDQLTPFGFSNFGLINYPLIKQMVDNISFYFKSQSILIELHTLNNCLSISLSFSKDIYQADEVLDVINEVIKRAKVL